MKSKHASGNLFTVLAVVLAIVSVSGCAPPQPRAVTEEATTAEKIPMTTTSEEARALYVEGRELADKLRNTDANGYFVQAIEKDPSFALAHLGKANTSASAKEFFAEIAEAVALADQASEGEKLFILATDAGVRGDPKAQREYLGQLVSAHPGDERAHNQLAGFYNGRQEYDAAIEHYNHAIEINSEYSGPYNSLGYAYRTVGDYEKAEAAFRKYIELIPDEPNPYDSYAELLMKTGRFEESIEQYQKALEIDPNFVFSLQGIGNNQIFMDKPEEARETLQTFHQQARTDGERRTAIFWTAASYLYEGDHRAALDEIEKMKAIAEAKGDLAAEAGDLTLMGNVLLEGGSADEALGLYQQSVETMGRADVSDEVKGNARRNHDYFVARVALGQGDLTAARESVNAYAAAVEAKQIPFEVRRVHELEGLIALHEEDYEGAVSHLEQANQQNPRILYHLARACNGAGDVERARALAEQAGNFNQLNVNFAYVRDKARELAAEL